MIEEAPPKEFPTVTSEYLKSIIVKEQYHTFDGNTLTICVLTLVNGFTVTGESACASPENFDKSLGQKYAYENAFNKLWKLEGYLLKEKLYQFKRGLEIDIGMG